MNSNRFPFYLLISFLVFSFSSTAQNCDAIRVDIKKGTINKLKLSATQETVKKKLPCFSGTSEDGSAFNCGGGVFYLKQDFFFYTGKDFLNIRKNFTGGLSIALLGISETEAIEKIGPVIRTQEEDEARYIFFKTAYGCLVALITNEKIEQLYLYNIPAANVKLCL